MSDPFIHHVAGPVKFGRKPPDYSKRRLHFGSFITRTELPAPPESTETPPLAQPCLDQMMLNDTLSCCTSVMSFKIAALILGNAGTAIKFSNAQVQAFYSLSTGYVPGHPDTDQGGNELDVLNCWQKHGLEKGLHANAGHVTVDAVNKLLVQTAASKMVNLGFGVSLPDAWLTANPGSTFDASQAPNPNNGHAFPGTHYDKVGVWVMLWGKVPQRFTWDAVARYASAPAGGELHTAVSHDAITKGSQKPFSGISWPEMQAAFRALGGTSS